jgi:hypothetical protein
MPTVAIYTPDSQMSDIMDRIVVPVDRVEKSGSMSQDESTTTSAAVEFRGHRHEMEEIHQPLWWSRVRELGSDFFSEFFATMILILFGDGVVAQVVLSKGANGDYQSISWGWG